MYSKIEEQIGRTLNPTEFQKLDELAQTYSVSEMVEYFKKYRNKHFNYVITVLKNNPKKQTTEWMNKEIENEPIDEETLKEHQEFLDFINEFRK